jgi:hypothetical protein
MNLNNLELFAIRLTDHTPNPVGEVQEPKLVNTNLYTHHQAALIEAIEFADKLLAEMIEADSDVAVLVELCHANHCTRSWTIEYNDDGAVIFCDGEAAWTVEAFIMTVKE